MYKLLAWRMERVDFNLKTTFETVDFRSSSYCPWDPRKLPSFLRTSVSPVIMYNDWSPSRHSQPLSLKSPSTAEAMNAESALS